VPKVLAGGQLTLLLAVIAPARTATAVEPQRVEISIAAEPDVSESVSAVLRDSLGRRGLEVNATAVPRIDPLQLVRSSAAGSPTGLVARVWLDLAAKQPTLYLIAEPSGLIYTRPLAVHAEPDPVELELIRFLVDSAVQAILEGQALGISRDEFERSLAAPVVTRPAPGPPPLPPAPAVRKARPKWTITAGYTGARLSSGVFAHGPEVGTELRWPRLHLGITLLQWLPVTLTSPDVNAILLSSGLRVFAAVPAAIGTRMQASFGIGAGIDVTRVAPGGTGARPTFWVTDPLALAIATFQRSFGRVIGAVDAGVDFELLGARYSAIRPGGAVVIWTPQHWRPFVAARLGVAF
jgi:hypothetical protein